MSLLGIGAAAVAICLGLSGPRFWWKGLANLLGLSLLFTIISIAATRASTDPLKQGVEFQFSAASIARGTGILLVYMLVFYGVAIAVRSLVGWPRKSVKHKPVKPE